MMRQKLYPSSSEKPKFPVDHFNSPNCISFKVNIVNSLTGSTALSYFQKNALYIALANLRFTKLVIAMKANAIILSFRFFLSR